MEENEKYTSENYTTEDVKEESALMKAYQTLQKNSVSKEKYEKDIAELKEKNQIYLQAITEGKEIDLPEENCDNVQDIIADISKFKGTNLEYWQKMTNAIDQVLRVMPEEEITAITGPEGLDEIVKVNESMKKIVKDSDGNPGLFRTIFEQRVSDSAPKISAAINSAGSLVNYLQNQKQ